MASQIQHPNLPLPDYFSRFANIYVRQTGHSTLNILANVITENVQTARIGAAALVARLPKEQLPKKLLVSDNVAMMVSAARESLTASPLPHVDCKELDSQDLSAVSDNYFTHSINNFSIFTFIRPVDAIRETYRTLRPGGLAIITCSRRFAPMYIVHAAQKKIRSDLPLMPSPGPEFYEEGGFTSDKITLVDKVMVIADHENIAGLTALMSGPLMAKAREGYTAEEEARWAESISQSVKEELEQFGGIRFEAYIILATK
ncbi:hypothetical protein FHL15_003507 [Xylaria flabelliformis]|uniref:Methyltransferase type 11 domain-containing protein n=1 Tax=Xylaria flabelliformis TaxID=2512241 RepID=A0A553I5S1_9PEZI|nr:hypothetical protein FHL15_003507 [Xylaria flabelliformis]